MAPTAPRRRLVVVVDSALQADVGSDQRSAEVGEAGREGEGRTGGADHRLTCAAPKGKGIGRSVRDLRGRRREEEEAA
jgi:hypothetical protein